MLTRLGQRKSHGEKSRSRIFRHRLGGDRGCPEFLRKGDGQHAGWLRGKPRPAGAKSRPDPDSQIAPAVGWPDGTTPHAASGLAVNEFASGLDHPRWLHVLPNGDVLVAESNAPAQHDAGSGLKGWVMGLVMARAGAGLPSADRISLLRDADGDGVAETRTVFLDNLHSPFGMALIGQTLYVANTDAVVAFPYVAGATRIAEPGKIIFNLPAGPINHHWTKVECAH